MHSGSVQAMGNFLICTLANHLIGAGNKVKHFGVADFCHAPQSLKWHFGSFSVTSVKICDKDFWIVKGPSIALSSVFLFWGEIECGRGDRKLASLGYVTRGIQKSRS